MKKQNLVKWLIAPFSAGLLGIAANTAAPDFTAKNQDGKSVKLSDFKGQFVLMYFYPKDDTPGCTKEACDFRDKYTEIRKLNATVLGVSRQDEKSHQAFIAKHKLPFDLLIDDKGDIAKLYGVGTIPVIGFHKRQSILIGPDMKVVKFYDSVDPAAHVAEVIADIKAAKK